VTEAERAYTNKVNMNMRNRRIISPSKIHHGWICQVLNECQYKKKLSSRVMCKRLNTFHNQSGGHQ